MSMRQQTQQPQSSSVLDRLQWAWLQRARDAYAKSQDEQTFNPVSQRIVDGRTVQVLPNSYQPGTPYNADAERGAAVDLLSGMVPGLGDARDAYEAGTGVDQVSGEKMGALSRILAGAGASLPILSGAMLRKAPKVFYHGSPQKLTGDLRTNRSEFLGGKGVFDAFFVGETPDEVMMYAQMNPKNINKIEILPDAKVLDLSDDIISEEVLSSQMARSEWSSLKPPSKPFPFQEEFEQFSFNRLNAERVKNGRQPFTREDFDKRLKTQMDPSNNDWNLEGLSAKYLEEYIKSKGYDVVRFGRETAILNTKKASVLRGKPKNYDAGSAYKLSKDEGEK